MYSMKLKSAMNNRHLKKKVSLFIISLITIISVINPFNVDAGTVMVTSYGSYSMKNGYFDILSNTIDVWQFDYEFNGEYNGRFTITFNQAINSTSISTFIEDCYIENYPTTSSVTIAFKNTSAIQLGFTGTFPNALSVVSITNYNMTKITDGVNTQLQSMSMAISDIEQTINSIYNSIDNIDTSVILVIL